MHRFKHPALFALAVLAIAAPAAADDFSTSIMRPTPVDPSTGMVAGKLPGSGSASYYFAVDLRAGDLMTQLQITGRPNGERRLTLQLLDVEAKVAASTFVRAGFGAKDEGTKSFAIDSSGRHVIRLTVEGEETGTFCVLMGGTALPNAKASGCPAPTAAAPAIPPPPARIVAAPVPVVSPAPPPPAPKAVEVITSKCEERLRVGSDFLFDFDRADVRPEAGDALAEVARHIAAAHKAVMIEGHTDGKGSDGYNQSLSERRAAAVRNALVGQGSPDRQLIIHGFGKSRPIAPNQQADGSDDPAGRQKNRRVEVVINTCS
jgi:outer membrane protein OmpA-like peptidoglycan-associated protein